jgi:hypothetical protein
MTCMKDINTLLQEAEQGKNSSVFDRITDEAKPFWEGCIERLESGHNIKPYVVHRLLREEFGVKISESAIRNYFMKVRTA